MKKYLTILALLATGISAFAQTPEEASATQTTNLSLTDAIELTFVGTGSETGASVTLAFNSINKYANGVQSSSQSLKVRSNKRFNIAVKANDANFTYSGSESPAPVMPVSSVLDVRVSSNSTGGSIPSGFSSFKDVTTTTQNIITNGGNGGNQRFSVRYRATPGFNYPAGNYTIDVVYTATQL